SAGSRFFAFGSRMEAKTLWPTRARASAVARPKPLLAPVIRIVLDMSGSFSIESHSLGLFRQFAGEKVANNECNLRSLAFRREMTRVKQMHLGIRNVLLERLGASGQEKRIVLAPYGQQRRPLRPQVLLEFGIERDIALVVAEQIELDLVIAGPGK